jgi:aquaporin Z
VSNAELNDSDVESSNFWPHLGLSGLPKNVVERLTDFNNPKQEWRRLFSEVMGTFLLLLVAAGSGLMNAAFGDPISRTAAVVAPGLIVMAMILFMGRVSGAHFNPAVSVAFALRGDFPWRRVPGYIVAQFTGAVLAVLLLQTVIGESASNGGTYPAQSTTHLAAFVMEVILTFGLVSVILGTASGAQNIGIIGALGVGGYVALAGLWASPLSGASMNPMRSLAPDLVANDFTAYWVYLAGPLLGAAIAVLAAYMLRGRGGGLAGSQAAQGGLFTQPKNPGKA